MTKQDDWVLQELEALFHSSYQSIFVTDTMGNVLRVSDSVVHTCGLEAAQLVGQTVYELERQKVFYPSVTRAVIKSKKRETVVQHTRLGHTLLVEAIPIEDQHGNIQRIVSISKDISEVHQLKEQIAELSQLMEGYQQELLRLKQKQTERTPFIAKSQAMRRIVALMKRVAFSDASVLILGETGVGKQVVANKIHEWGDRHDKPFITINCGAIPENLLESELFGYEPGAFSGAKREGKLGIFELANGGTVFLDEIGELPYHLQVKLLRVLQERRVMRVGGTRERAVDIRVIAATNQDLEQMVKEKRFRQDLYYRIHVIPIWIPPLRERREDLHSLIHTFLDYFNQKYQKQKSFSQRQLQELLHYSWPGNVRELENTIERFVLTGQTILSPPSSLPSDLASSTLSLDKPFLSLPERLKQVERELLLQAQQHCRTTREMASFLGINQSTVVRKLQNHGLQ